MTKSNEALLGRDDALARLTELIVPARHQARATVITGEAGVGKTALMRHAQQCADGYRVLRTEGIELEVGMPFAGLQPVVGPLLEQIPGIAERHRAVLRSALGVGDPVAHDEFAVAASVLGALASATEIGPVLVLIDDAQWVDEASLRAVTFAFRRLADQPLVLVIARRATGHRLRATEGLPEIVLTRVGAATAREIVSRHATRTLAAAELELIVTLAGGVPLALVELARTSPADLTALHADRTPDALDRVVGRLFGRRVDVLPPPAASAALVAALEEPDEYEAIIRAAGRLGADAASWAHLEDSAIVRIGTARIDFEHPLLRASIVGNAAPQARRAAHAALAEAMTRRHDGSRSLVHRSMATLGADEELAAQLEAAAAAHRTRGGHPAALNALLHAARLSADTDDQARRLLLAADAARRAGNSAQAADLVAKARSACADPELQARCDLLLGHLDARSGSTTEALRRYQRVAERAADLSPDLVADALCYASSAAAVVGDATQALAAAQQAEALGDLGADASVAVRETVASALALSGRAPAARPMLRELSRWYRRQDDRSGAEYIAESLIWLGDFALARELLDDVVADARRLAAPGLLVQALELRADLGFRTGDWTGALADAHEAITLAQDSDQAVLLAYSLAIMAVIQAARGDDSARPIAQQARRSARRHGLTVVAETASYALGTVDLAAGDPSAALLELEPLAVAAAAGGRDEPAVLLWAPDLIEALLAVGRRADAEAAIDRLARQAASTESAWALGAATRYRAQLAADDRFDALFAEADRLHERSGMPHELARTRLSYGQRLRRSGRRLDARVQLRAALAVFEDLGAKPWIARAQRELTGSGEQRKSRGPDENAATLHALTPQELQIAKLVAGGASNRETATELFLSPKTIETHLTHIYRKLGVRSRSQLTNRLSAAVALPD